MKLTVIILTLNEERHLARCIRSIQPCADRIVVIDSQSTDKTVELARQLGAETVVRPFINQAEQFNWALDNLDIHEGLVFRLDADEVADEELCRSVRSLAEQSAQTAAGYSVVRQIHFLGRTLRWGGLGSIKVVRIFQVGFGRSEQRWMDEHIVVSGPINHLKGRILDHNTNDLSWWVQKHNGYASREVLDLLAPACLGSVPGTRPHWKAALKRKIKLGVLYRGPMGLGPLLYFSTRYLLLAGFLDGRAGFIYHFMQALWYRTLVQAKLAESKLRSGEVGVVDEGR